MTNDRPSAKVLFREPDPSQGTRRLACGRGSCRTVGELCERLALRPTARPGPARRDRWGQLANGGHQRLLPLESSLWYFRNLAVVAVVSAVLLLLAIRMFTRVEGDFAEEL